ncbi:tyrosinase family protein [Hafnia paralvei]|uniref:tyrosinase family protein n=1 Tax=Hafnia paralvei TaxID=546367 RepID=UPI0037BF2B81
MSKRESPFSLSRRRLIIATTLTTLAAALPFQSAFSAMPSTDTKRRYTRVNLNSREGQKMLESYQKGIRAMLALPPSDPLNWYRHTLIHTLDCPHGNWWFLPWHRGYVGWFEKIIRKLSGDADFAMPFWDWTAEPRIPEVFFDGVLNPDNQAFIDSYAKFREALFNPVEALWGQFTPQQLHELQLRNYPYPRDLWRGIEGDGKPEDAMFFPRGQTRALTQDQPNFDCTTQNAVSLETILDALAPRSFELFGSESAPNHSNSHQHGFGILEAFPHNKVHNDIGGFMGNFLSPVDPVFFMHHANLDRLWEVWRTKQIRDNLPTEPQTGLSLWKNEPFLFYVDENGRPVQKNSAGDYAQIGDFDYDYQTGSGDSTPRLTQGKVSSLPALQLDATLDQTDLSNGQIVNAQVILPKPLQNSAELFGDEQQRYYALVEIMPMSSVQGVSFNVALDKPSLMQKRTQVSAVDTCQDPVNSFAFFGSMDMTNMKTTFMVPMTAALRGLSGSEKSSGMINIYISATTEDDMKMKVNAKVLSVILKTF